MKGQKSNKSKKELYRNSSIAMLLLNVLLLFGVILLCGKYSQTYMVSLREENISNIRNLNRASSVIVTSLFDDWRVNLNNIAQYIQNKDVTYNEALDIINSSNFDENRFFQLIDSSYIGHRAKKNTDNTYTELSYEDGTYFPQQKVFNDTSDINNNQIHFVPEFTDDATKDKIFALCKHIKLKNEEGKHEVYTLLLAFKSDSILAYFDNLDGYEGQATVLIDSEGNYIIKNSYFTSTNFFQYLYNSNDLSLDQKNSIINEVKCSSNGELFYKNSKAIAQDCVFSYEKILANNWYCITAVSLDSFHSPVFSFHYLIVTTLLLAILLIIDVTWMQLTNRVLRNSMHRAIEANAYKSSFMSRMSHEIRTPLNAIIGYNTIARDELIKNKNNTVVISALDCLTKSNIASKHLINIINDILDMSAIESGKIKVAHDSFDLAKLLESLKDLFYAQAQKKDIEFVIDYKVHIDEWIVADQMRINQILANLLSNAIKFTSEGGKIILTVCCHKLNDSNVNIDFEVMDNGIGMAKEYIERVWEPYEQADSSISRNFGGTGLGLAITKNLVELMNGSITVESKLGVGTKFNVNMTFNLIPKQEQKHKISKSYNFKGCRVLLAEDNAMNMEITKRIFNSLGLAVDNAWNGQEALNIFEKMPAQTYSAIIMDIHMPVMDGHAATKAIRALSRPDAKTIPIIAMTADVFAEHISEALSVGMNAHIEKPVDVESIIEVLSEFIK